MKYDPDKLHQIKFADDLGANVSNEKLIEQVNINIRRRLPQAKPYLPNEETVALVCGGPSLKTHEKELVAAVWAGAKVACVNGSYQWCIERNIRPSTFIMVDGRAFNARFVETLVDDCRYLLAGQCHPDTFEICKDRDVTIWHAVCCQAEQDLLKAYYFEKYYPVNAGTTVATNAIALMRMLGFQKFICFGFDSCWLGDEHHAYAQAENAAEMRKTVWLRPREREDLVQGPFDCAAWHVKQALDFQKLIRERGDTFQLDVRGPGLIAAIMKVASQIGIEQMLIESKPQPKET